MTADAGQGQVYAIAVAAVSTSSQPLEVVSKVNDIGFAMVYNCSKKYEILLYAAGSAEF
jgi:hypothetical protein